MSHNVFAVGVSHTFLNVSDRSRFSLSLHEQELVSHKLKETGIDSFVILNTCNRTELYGVGSHNIVVETIVSVKSLREQDQFQFFCYTGSEAIQHIFRVVSGLDSQIIGDLEILGQCKTAFKNAKTNQHICGYLERLGNTAIQTAKEIRTKTKLSSGTVSLSYAAIKLIDKISKVENKKVLLIGVGAFGRKIAFNIKDYLPNVALSICNRTQEKALLLAKELDCEVISFEWIKSYLSEFDVIISTIQPSGSFLIESKYLPEGVTNKKFIDMSVPFSIDPTISNINGNRVFTIDDLEEEISTTLVNRMDEIPAAEFILDNNLAKFIEWSSFFNKSESIKVWKSTFSRHAQSCPVFQNLEDSVKNNSINKQTSAFVKFLKTQKDLPNNTNQLINQFLIHAPNPVFCIKSELNNIPFSKSNCSTCQPK
jgi:glutamyl-tRNA reductase